MLEKKDLHTLAAAEHTYIETMWVVVMACLHKYIYFVLCIRRRLEQVT